MQHVSAVTELAVSIVRVLVLALLLEVGLVGVVVDRLVEIVDLLVRQHTIWSLQEVVVEIHAEFGLTIVYLE